MRISSVLHLIYNLHCAAFHFLTITLGVDTKFVLLPRRPRRSFQFCRLPLGGSLLVGELVGVRQILELTAGTLREVGARRLFGAVLARADQLYKVCEGVMLMLKVLVDSGSDGVVETVGNALALSHHRVCEMSSCSRRTSRTSN